MYRISERLWQAAKEDEEIPAQPRLELKRFDVAFFNEILKEPAAVKSMSGPSNSPTITQKHIWANLQVFVSEHMTLMLLVQHVREER